MVIADRVVCDFCYCLIGQLFNVSAQAPDLIFDLAASPHFCVCPDCYAASRVHPDYAHLVTPYETVQKCIGL